VSFRKLLGESTVFTVKPKIGCRTSGSGVLVDESSAIRKLTGRFHKGGFLPLLS
jgi:hypothetical protein